MLPCHGIHCTNSVNSNSNGNGQTNYTDIGLFLAAVSLRCRMEKPSANPSLVGSKVWMQFCSGITSVPSWPIILPSKSLYKELQPTASHLRRKDICFKEQLFAASLCWHHILTYFKCRDRSYCFSSYFSDYAGEKKPDHTETTFCKYWFLKCTWEHRKRQFASFTVKPVFQVTNLLVCISKTTLTKSIAEVPW